MYPRISIIVPVYNKQKQIERCILSVVKQSYKEWELILIDDGSTDDSAFIIQSYLSDSRISYFYKENGGGSSARNMGMKKASGEWIIFLDADDYFLPNALSILLDFALSHGTLIAAANFYVEHNGKRYGLCEGRKRVVKNNFRSWYFMTCYFRAGSVLFHSSIIKNHFFDESLSRYEDIKWGFDVIRGQKIAYTSDYVMIYSEDNLGLSKRSSNVLSDYSFSMTFSGVSFWEKIVLAKLLKQSLNLYPEYNIFLKERYHKYLSYLYIEQIICIFPGILMRMKRMLRKIYGIFSN